MPAQLKNAYFTSSSSPAQGYPWRKPQATLSPTSGHFCKQQKLDYLAIVKAGVGHWYVERTRPDSIEMLPDVTITINQ